MAKVLNKTGFPQCLFSKNGESCQIPVGESKVEDKFCVNLPPKVILTEKPREAKSYKVIPVKNTRRKEN